MTRPAVLVTRAEPGAGETAARLDGLGIEAVVSPMIALSLAAPLPPLRLDGAQGLLFTSANGVRFFTKVSARRDLTAWCVGPATLEAARGAGFPARCAHGDADALAGLVISEADPAAGPLVHVANAAAAGTLAARLGTAGFEVRLVPLYRPSPAGALTDPAAGALRAHRVCAVLFHSARGADAFAALARGLDLSQTAAVAISQRAAMPLAGLAWARLILADHPDEDHLMAALSLALTAD